MHFKLWNVSAKVQALLKNQEGQDLIEYALVRCSSCLRGNAA